MLKQVVPIDLASYCDEYGQDGAELTIELLYSDRNHFTAKAPDFYPLVYNYYTMDQNVKSNDTDSVDRTWTKPCIEIMSKDISVVKVPLETSKYMKTIMDRRLSFTDKLAAFGMCFPKF